MTDFHMKLWRNLLNINNKRRKEIIKKNITIRMTKLVNNTIIWSYFASLSDGSGVFSIFNYLGAPIGRNVVWLINK